MADWAGVVIGKHGARCESFGAGKAESFQRGVKVVSDYDLLSRLCGVRRWLVVLAPELIGRPGGRVALTAWETEKRVMLRLEKPPAEVMQMRVNAYFRGRLEEALGALALDPEPLAEVLEEILLLVDGAQEIVGWRPLSLGEALALNS